jgi:hypothetical protein
MAVEEMITSLPTVSAATMQDIIYAVQGYVSPSVLGTSVQETLQQVYNLFQGTIVLTYPGNPNGFVAGTVYQLLWDSVDDVLWVCTTSGTASTAVWQQCISSQSNWTNATTSNITIVPDMKYVVNNGASLITFTLPTTAAFGTTIEISGFSSGGWKVTQNSGQQIHFGALATTTTTGSVASANQYDYIKLLCVTANTTWNVVGSIGNITLV